VEVREGAGRQGLRRAAEGGRAPRPDAGCLPAGSQAPCSTAAVDCPESSTAHTLCAWSACQPGSEASARPHESASHKQDVARPRRRPPPASAARRNRALRSARARAAARGVRRQARHLPAGPPARAVRLRRVRGAAGGRARADVHAVRGARGRRRGQEVEVVHAHPPRRRARGARRRAPDAPADARACGAAPARPGRGRSGAAALPGERCRGWVGQAATGAAWPAGARDECEGKR